MATKDLSTGRAISFGWETFKKDAAVWIGIGIAAAILSAVANSLDAAILSLGIITMLAGAFILMTIAKIALDYVDGKPFDFNEVTPVYSRYLNLLIAYVIFGIAAAIGFILLIIPGIIISIRLQFYPFYIIENKGDMIESLRMSWEDTKGYTGQLFVFGLACIGIIILGALAFGIGLFVAMPVITVAWAYMYRKVTGSMPGEMAAPAAPMYAQTPPAPAAPAPQPMEEPAAPAPAPEPVSEPAPAPEPEPMPEPGPVVVETEPETEQTEEKKED